jgi:hypothetical protein
MKYKNRARTSSPWGVRLTCFIIGLLGCAVACSGSSSGACYGETDEAFCARLRGNCGVLTAIDACGVQRSANCGSCSSGQTCGGAAVPNQCGVAAEQESDGGASGTPDGCTFACPTRAHSIAATITVNDVNFKQGALGRFGPMKGETFDVLLSFDELTPTKDPPEVTATWTRYVTRILSQSHDIASQGDSSQLFDAAAKTVLNKARGTATFTIRSDSSITDFRFVAKSGDDVIVFVCDVPAPSLGVDHYIIPEPFACSKGYWSLSIDASDAQYLEHAEGRTSFVYR